MPKLNQGGVVHVLLIILLIIGIIAGVYLVQKTQIFAPKASVSNVEWVISSGDESNCVTVKDGRVVTTCEKVKFKVNIGLDGSANVSTGSNGGNNPPSEGGSSENAGEP